MDLVKERVDDIAFWASIKEFPVSKEVIVELFLQFLLLGFFPELRSNFLVRGRCFMP